MRKAISLFMDSVSGITFYLTACFWLQVPFSRWWAVVIFTALMIIGLAREIDQWRKKDSYLKLNHDDQLTIRQD